MTARRSWRHCRDQSLWCREYPDPMAVFHRSPRSFLPRPAFGRAGAALLCAVAFACAAETPAGDDGDDATGGAAPTGGSGGSTAGTTATGGSGGTGGALTGGSSTGGASSGG